MQRGQQSAPGHAASPGRPGRRCRRPLPALQYATRSSTFRILNGFYSRIMARMVNEGFQRVQSLLRRLARRHLRRRHGAAGLAGDVGLRRGLRRGAADAGAGADRAGRPVGLDRRCAGRWSAPVRWRWWSVYIAVYNVDAGRPSTCGRPTSRSIGARFAHRRRAGRRDRRQPDGEELRRRGARGGALRHVTAQAWREAR